MDNGTKQFCLRIPMEMYKQIRLLSFNKEIKMTQFILDVLEREMERIEYGEAETNQ